MADKPKRAPQFLAIPSGTPPRKCDRCPATIYFIRTAKGKRMPVRADVEGGREPFGGNEGRGLSHFADCPAANHFRNPRP